VKKLNKAYEFRIYPNKEQQVILAKTFGSVRFIYNKMLSDKIEYYEDKKVMLKTTPAQYKTEYPWLKEVDSLALANAQLNLEVAYKNFFRSKHTGFPKFKSKHRDRNSYTTNCVNNNIRIIENGIFLPKLGRIKLKKHRNIPEDYKLKSCTISKTCDNKYYISILYEYKQEIIEKKIKKVIGLDFSMKELYINSNGESAEYPQFYRISQKKLVKEQRKLSKCKKGSNNRKKQKKKVGKLHRKVANQRKDFLHKQSRQITNDYDAVIIENLNMKDMSRALKFGKSVHDNSWGMFSIFLEYKLRGEGKQLIKIDKWFPSSKTCSVCNNKKEELKLSDRKYVCECGNIMDRDINAAINIRKEGMKLLGVA